MSAGLAQNLNNEPPRVWSVSIEGNESFPDGMLNNQIAVEAPTFWQKIKFWNKSGSVLNENELRKDAIRIRNFYNRRGYNSVSVAYRIEDGNKNWKRHVVFTIDENAPIRIRNVEYIFEAGQESEREIRKSSTFQAVRDIHPYQPGTRFEPIREPEVIGSFTDVLKNMGYAYAGVDISATIDSVSLSADLTIQIKPGPKAYLANINVEGIQTVTEDYVIRESGLKTGDQFSYDRLQESQQELFSHHLFRFVTIGIPDQEEDSTLDLQVRVRERALRAVQTSIGFGNEELLRGELSWRHRNVLGRGHRFSATGRASFIEQTAKMDYLFPYVFNTKSSFVISPFVQHQLEKSFELLRGGVTNSLIYKYSQKFTGTFSYQYTTNIEFSEQLDASLPDTTLRFDLSSLQFSGFYREGALAQQSGWAVQPYAEISGLFGTAAFSFQKLSLDVRRYTELSNSTVLATRVQGGGLFNVSTDSLPNNIRFFLGGTNSVRGWFRQELGPKRPLVRVDSVMQDDGTFRDTTEFDRFIPVGGRSMFGFNIEIRQELDSFIKGFGIAAFLDGGQVWEDIGSIGDRPLQFGVGGGFRYRSPIGPLRIDLGYKVNPSDEDLDIFQGQDFGDFWDKIGIHFSIGQAF